MSTAPVITERQARYAAIAAMLVGLGVCLHLGLIGALLGGLLVHELVHAIAPRISFGKSGATRARVMSVGLIGALVIGALVAAGFAAVAFFRSASASSGCACTRGTCRTWGAPSAWAWRTSSSAW